MAGSIWSGVVNSRYDVGWERAFGGSDEALDALAGLSRKRRPHDCERCGHHMEWDDQECGCTAKDPWQGR